MKEAASVTRGGGGPARRGAWIAGALLAVGALALLARHLYAGRYAQRTDDAYVEGFRITVAPQISGTVTAVDTANTQFVRQGQVLLTLDPSDAKIALSAAEAKLAGTLRSVAGLFDAVSADRAAVDSAEATLAQANRDLARALRLAPVHGVSRELVEHAQTARRAAADDLVKARQRLQADRSLVGGTTVDTNPVVEQAKALVRAAWLTVARTSIRAPVSGYVSQSAVEPGDQVSPAVALMTIVPLDRVWVDANFKETEMTGMRIGQPVTLTADLYGASVTYHGHVLGFAAGTGSAFALLPPEDASGNWIKVVQRLPVRIGLERAELEKKPLALGLSVEATVDTRDRSGERLSRTPRWVARRGTDVYRVQGNGADGLIAAIVAHNLPMRGGKRR